MPEDPRTLDGRLIEGSSAAPVYIVNTTIATTGGGGGGGGGDASAANQTTQITAAGTTNTRIGDLTDAAPANDTAAASINGRLQRAAQRLSTLITTAATEVTLALVRTAVDAINAKLPALSSGRVPVDGSGVVQPVSGSVGVAGTVTANLGTIADVATNTTLATRVAETTFTTRIPVNGQAAMAASVPVAIASNQTPVPVAGAAAHDAPVSGNPILLAGFASAAAPAAVADGDAARLWVLADGRLVIGNLSTQPLITRSNASAPGVTTLTVTNGAYAALDVFGGLVTIDALFPAAGNAAGGGRAFTITEITIETGNVFPLYFVACTRTPSSVVADNGVFLFEPSRQLAPRPMTTQIQTDANSWTCFLEQPITVVQSLLDTTDDFSFYLVAATAASHTGTVASVRIAGYLD